MTGGNPQGLARAERRLGLDSRSVAFCQNYLAYPCDEVLWQEGTPLWHQQLACWGLLQRAYRDFDVVHYNTGSTILPWSFSSRWARRGTVKGLAYQAYADICRPVERRLLDDKVIAVTFQGDDARQGDYSREHFDISIAAEVGEDYYSPESDARTRQRISWFDEYADLIYAVNPDLLHVLPARAQFMPYAHLDIDDWQIVQQETAIVPLVLHAPSHRGAKGTRFILEAVEQLRAERISFDFILVEGMSNAEARRLYERADLIIDQLLAGWYGGLAVEAMALGKPVICYLRRTDLSLIPKAMREELPIIEAQPATVQGVLRDWLTHRRGDLRQTGARSRAYVEHWHDPSAIATRLAGDYRAAAAVKHRARDSSGGA